jgi:hypothetical protein
MWMWSTIISVIFLPCWSCTSLTPMSVSCWFYALVHLISFPQPWPSLVLHFYHCQILCLPSTKDRSKPFSTCSSHMLVVVIFGSLAFMYLQPPVSSMDQSKVSSVFYFIFFSMLNPLIYSLRSKDVNVVLKKILELREFPWTDVIVDIGQFS